MGETMRHFISIAVLLAVFFWAGPGAIQHVFARSFFVVASDGNGKVSKEETQAKAQAKRRYDNFMKVYNKIWIIYGFYHKEFNGTPGNIRYARIIKNWQSYSKHKKTLVDIANKLNGSSKEKAYSDLDAQAKAAGFHSRKEMLKQRANYLISDIEDMRRKLAKLKKTAARIDELAPTVNALMKKACAAKTRVEAKSLAKECIFEASDAIRNYKAVRDWILPEIEKKRKEYLLIRSDFESTVSLVREHQKVYKDMIGSEEAMLKDLQEVSTEHYLNNKRNRFDQLVTKLNNHHSELKGVLKPYPKHDWAKAMIDNSHAASVRVGSINKTIHTHNYKGLDNLGNSFYRKDVWIPTVFFDVEKDLETFFGLVSSTQEVGRACKASAIAARDDAKKAVACAKKLPDEPTKSKKEHRCPSNWNECGSSCCPPDVPCWNYEARERAVRAGRCR